MEAGMCRNVALLAIVLLGTILLSGCPPNPLSGVIPEKQTLVADTGKAVTGEAEAVQLVRENLSAISAADLIRISGEIDQDTLLGITARREEGGDFQAHIEYTYKESSGAGDTGKLVIIVTPGGKIFGMSPGAR